VESRKILGDSEKRKFFSGLLFFFLKFFGHLLDLPAARGGAFG
jgi:hypothetical protein